MIKSVIIIVGALAVATPAMAAPICLRLHDIASTHSLEGKVLMVIMRDGEVWRNDLQGSCPDLKFEGFKWVIHGPAEVCEFTQSLEVLRSGQICTLGKFTPQSNATK